ncbi:MAG: hypothetical protein CVU90_13870 [Firmicutes bacterium HGW-Firmicutes-15]|nr:MAG: hypothetical protein CVU90_13870 [Firmicutes bacterium HGW-Firmicutes-15]
MSGRPPSGRLRAEGREHPSLIIAQRTRVSADRAARSPVPERDIRDRQRSPTHKNIIGELVPRAERSAAGSSGRPPSGRAMSGTE